MYNNAIKFSLWCDFIEREFLKGEFCDLIDRCVINGATSNPAIFKSAFSSEIYKQSAKHFGIGDKKALYETLAVLDIKIAANKLLKNFANGDDGFVSIEVDPNLANDTDATIKEGERLFSLIKMPNVMIKIPATNAGFKAMSALMAKGINVNATLIFSPEQAQGCIDAFKEGSEIYAKTMPDTPLPKGVISVFVSRFDRLLDADLKAKNLPTAKVGILNATKIYHLISKANLANVRTLFASTGVKGNELRADYYVRELMFENTINTAPLDTIKAFIKENSHQKDPADEAEINEFFSAIKSAGIDINKAYKELMDDGLKAFVVAFDEILKEL